MSAEGPVQGGEETNGADSGDVAFDGAGEGNAEGAGLRAIARRDIRKSARADGGSAARAR